MALRGVTWRYVALKVYTVLIRVDTYQYCTDLCPQNTSTQHRHTPLTNTHTQPTYPRMQSSQTHGTTRQRNGEPWAKKQRRVTDERQARDERYQRRSLREYYGTSGLKPCDRLLPVSEDDMRDLYARLVTREEILTRDVTVHPVVLRRVIYDLVPDDTVEHLALRYHYLHNMRYSFCIKWPQPTKALVQRVAGLKLAQLRALYRSLVVHDTPVSEKLYDLTISELRTVLCDLTPHRLMHKLRFYQARTVVPSFDFKHAYCVPDQAAIDHATPHEGYAVLGRVLHTQLVVLVLDYLVTDNRALPHKDVWDVSAWMTLDLPVRLVLHKRLSMDVNTDGHVYHAVGEEPTHASKFGYRRTYRWRLMHVEYMSAGFTYDQGLSLSLTVTVPHVAGHTWLKYFRPRYWQDPECQCEACLAFRYAGTADGWLPGPPLPPTSVVAPGLTAYAGAEGITCKDIHYTLHLIWRQRDTRMLEQSLEVCISVYPYSVNLARHVVRIAACERVVAKATALHARLTALTAEFHERSGVVLY